MTEPATPVRVDVGPDQMLTTTVDDPEQGWRRLSIRMLLVHPVMELMRFIPVLVLLVFFNRSDQNGLWPLLAVAAFVALGVARWFTTRYRVTPTQVQVRRGLFSKSHPVGAAGSGSQRRHDSALHAPIAGPDPADHRHRSVRSAEAGRSAAGRAHLRAPPSSCAANCCTSGPASTCRAPRRGPRPPRAVPAAPRETVIARFKPSWVRYAPFTLSGLTVAGCRHRPDRQRRPPGAGGHHRRPDRSPTRDTTSNRCRSSGPRS